MVCPRFERLLVFQAVFLLAVACADGQQTQSDAPIEGSVRAAIIGSLVSKIEAGYVVPVGAQSAVRRLRSAAQAGDYDALGSARKFAERITSDLRSATHDKHIALYFDPEAKQASAPGGSTIAPREHYNYGFNKLERLSGNVGYLELRSFANLQDATP